ncbi:MAG: 2-amino-3-carboxymuconate-6-semialdehyde decarboxylase [Candidatus Eremiobacteraeota bacterium]|nr:2-amino-3-carboxymuconate-6-semialdehyde decarboxylase [Candidatus Eremiobacteraeota bacterium]
MLETSPGTVDFHTHYIDSDLAGLELAGCVHFTRTGPDAGDLHRDGRHYRALDARSWDLERRIDDMDRNGVSLQVLSAIPVTLGYDAPAALAAASARVQNDALAAVVRRRPDRFAALGVVPLQDVDLACAELERLIQTLGLAGVEIGTTVGGRELDDPALDPFWERCEALQALVFIHPESAPGFDRLRKRMLVVSTGYPSETGIAAAAILTSGLLERRTLRIVLAHGGGTLPYLLPRLDRLWDMSEVARASSSRPSTIAKRFYCDALTFDPTNLALVIERIGGDRVLVGSDYPFSIMEDPPGAATEGFDDATRRALRFDNARQLLRLAGQPVR